MVKRTKLMLRDNSRDADGFSTLDILNGLHGVCAALDSDIAENSSYDNADYLVQAARVLSTMLRDRVEV